VEITMAGDKPKAQLGGFWVVNETPLYPMDGVKRVPVRRKAQTESVMEKRTEIVEIDLDSRTRTEKNLMEKPRNAITGDPKGAKNLANKEKTGMGAKRVTRAAAAEGVGVEEVDLRESNENEKTPERIGSGRYPKRARRSPGWLRGSEEETVWVTPRAGTEGTIREK
jgi:hypothetical protein